MIKSILTFFFSLMILLSASGQNVGIGTTSPQARLDVNGTFRLQNGVTVNGISPDTTLSPGSDSLLVTQLAIKRYAENGNQFPPYQEIDTSFLGLQTLSMYPDSMLYLSPDGWQSDSALNVFTLQGNVGMGVSHPTTKLAIHGDQKIEGAHTLTLGSGLPDWQENAAKIGYGMLAANTLDILGGGPLGNKKIKLWNDTWLNLFGKSEIQGDASFQHGTFKDHVRANGNIGIGVMNPADELTVNGRVRITSGLSAARLGIFGSVGGYHMVLYRNGDCPANGNLPVQFQVGAMGMAQSANIIEIGTYLGSQPSPGLNVNGHTLVTDSLILQKITQMKLLTVYDTKTIELGAFIPGKEINAGKIGYQTFTPNALDIVGGGTTNTNRRIKFLANNSVIATGSVDINGTVHVPAIQNAPWTDLTTALQNNWVNYGNGFATAAMYKDSEGVVHLRGLIKNGLNVPNTLITTLPAGYRPVAGHQIFEVINGNDTFGRIDVETDGDVVFRGITNSFISLDQIIFKTN